ncbi:MAG: hypothetical protein CMH79_04190 [Nitrospinae bacterium]|nr:hypothetical protein [Nitrospinota bacterium]|tara:strand:- start:203 stop:865 length:663 start_codon:yes stop_codon:yes gene_type:complete
MDEVEHKKKPKKRGRKPKKKLPKEEQPEHKVNNNLIIKLKNIDDDNEVIEPFSINEECLIENNNKSSEVCWNCCHNFNNLIYGIPLKYINNVFYIYGDFCSLECCSRYVIDNFTNNYEITSLINLYNNIIKDRKDDNITPAPNRLLLNIFGGPLTINEYRNKFTNNIHDLKLPPILPIRHSIDTYEINNNNSKNNLKLYRKKPLSSEKKSITNSMNLTIN